MSDLPPPAPPRDWLARASLGLVLVLATWQCAWLFLEHRQHYRERWVGLGHDRNAHYRYGLELAADLKNGDWGKFLVDFDAGSWVWPPLNGVLLAAVTLMAGPGPIWAVLPSLLGWWLTIVFAFLIGRQLGERFGWLAGGLAALFVVASPAHRAYATDIMLESLGAGLTLAVLFAYLKWEERRTWQAAAAFGAALSLLYFQKYNYWLLVLIPITLTHGLLHWAEYRKFLIRFRDEIPWRSWLRSQCRRPLNYLIVPCVFISLAIAITGGTTIVWNGKPLEVRTNRLFVVVGYGLILLRFTIWWWTGGRHSIRTWIPAGSYPLLYWHLFPVLIWFLIPFRLNTFFWFISPANTERQYHSTFWDGARFYWNGATQEYALGSNSLLVLTLGCLFALVAGSQGLRRGRADIVVALFAGLGVFLTVKHPNHKLRFLMTVMPGVMLAGCVGWAWIGQQIMAWLERATGKPFLKPLAAVTLIAFMAFLAPMSSIGVALNSLGKASEAGLNGQGVSLRELTPVLQLHIPYGEPVAIFSNSPAKFWAKWAYLERDSRHWLLQVDCRQVGVLDPPTQDQFAVWCQQTDCRAVLWIEIPRESQLYEDAPESETNATVIRWLPGSSFRLQNTWEVPSCGTIQLWRR